MYPCLSQRTWWVTSWASSLQHGISVDTVGQRRLLRCADESHGESAGAAPIALENCADPECCARPASAKGAGDAAIYGVAGGQGNRQGSQVRRGQRRKQLPYVSGQPQNRGDSCRLGTDDEAF